MSDPPHGDRLRLLGEIALEVAHELRNLLLVIDGSTYLAQKDPAASAGHLEKIDRSVRAARAVVDDVFLLARDEPLPCEDTELVDVVTMARAELEEGCAEWSDQLGSEPLRVHDRLLARLFKVIYENAVQIRAPAKPRIETRAALAPAADNATHGHEMVVIEIEDDGPGVTETIATTLFEPLVSTRDGGTGMGLPLARRIALAHGGALSLVAGQGSGACFRIIVPRAPRRQ